MNNQALVTALIKFQRWCEDDTEAKLLAEIKELREVAKAAKEYREALRRLSVYEGYTTTWYEDYEVCKHKGDALDAALNALTESGAKLEGV